MASKIDILAPHTPGQSSALFLQRWLKMVGDPVAQNEPIAELVAGQAVIYVHAPMEGTIASMVIGPGQNILSGAVIGQVSVVSKDAVEWENFDQVTALLEEFADGSKDRKQLKDANEALGQLLGISDKDVFRAMNIEQQNKFLQNLVDQHKAHGLRPADVAQKLLEGLHLRMPANAPMGPSGPAFGLRGPAGPGMGGGGGVYYPPGAPPQQQQGYAPPNYPQQPPYYNPQGGQQQLPPNALPPQQWPPALPPSDDENK